MTIVVSKICVSSAERDKMVVVTNKPLEPESKVKSKLEEPENVVRITENPLSAKPYMKVEPFPLPIPIIHSDDDAQRLLGKALDSGNCREACHCIDYLTKSIGTLSLDKVAEHYRKLEPYTHEDSLAPSAPPIGMDEDLEQLMQLDGDADRKLNDHLHALIDRCLDRFDANANTFLTLPIFPSLTHHQLLAILTRHTFAVTNELLVYTAVCRWARSQPEFGATVRIGTVLGDLRYAPRYGLLTLEQFRQTSVDGVTGVKRGGVLTGAEYKACKNYIRDKARGRKVDELANQMSAGRRLLGDCKRMSVSSERTRLEKCLMYTLICFTAVFD